MDEAAPYRRVAPAACLDLAHKFELGPDGKGFARTSYIDEGVPAIGWGHRIASHADPLLHAAIDEAAADRLAEDDYQLAADALCDILGQEIVEPLTDDQFTALCDFVYNLGAGKFGSSTLCKLVKLRDNGAAGEEFMRWVYVRDRRGREVPSEDLRRRRQVEKNLWEGQGR